MSLLLVLALVQPEGVPESFTNAKLWTFFLVQPLCFISGVCGVIYGFKAWRAEERFAGVVITIGVIEVFFLFFPACLGFLFLINLLTGVTLFSV